MKIIVCVKEVAAVDFHLELNVNQGLDADDVIQIINPYDLVAVEEAISIKEKIGDTVVTLISLGPPSTRDMLRKCLAMGADDAIHLWDRVFDQSDAWATAVILAKKIKDMDYDLILCGKKSIDHNNGQVGTYVAELLDVPHVYAISKLEIEENKKSVRVHRVREGGDREVVLCPIPVVLSVDLELNQPRYPTFPVYLKSLRKEIVSYNAKSLGITRREVGRSGSRTKLVSLSLPKPRSKKFLKVDSSLSAEERLGMLMSGGVVEKDGSEILDGEAVVIAEKLVKFLADQGLL